MRLYVVRHGQAGPASSDSLRPLSDAGRAEVAKLGAYVAREGIRVGAVWHSSKVRARETAELLAEIGKLGGELSVQAGLRPEDEPEPIIAALKSRQEDICIVGHMPNVAVLVSTLLAGTGASPMSFSTATMACLDRDAQGAWRLLWHVSPASI